MRPLRPGTRRLPRGRHPAPDLPARPPPADRQRLRRPAGSLARLASISPTCADARDRAMPSQPRPQTAGASKGRAAPPAAGTQLGARLVDVELVFQVPATKGKAGRRGKRWLTVLHGGSPRSLLRSRSGLADSERKRSHRRHRVPGPQNDRFWVMLPALRTSSRAEASDHAGRNCA